VVLAAGLGRRFGGPKQLEPVGPGGATLMEYSVYDAHRAGFHRVVIVIRPDMAPAFAESGLGRSGSMMEIRLVAQRLEDLPVAAVASHPRRTPWGTGHAVLAARSAVAGNFAVLNGDDLYGPAALAAVARFLSAADPGEPHFAVAGYRLAETASTAGPVTRAVLEVGPDGSLKSLRERTELRRVESGWFEGQGPDGPELVPGDALVSMNLWGFTPRVFDILEAGFRAFLASGPGPSDEYHVPGALEAALCRGAARVAVLTPPPSEWCGLTHRGDLPAVRARLAALVQRGVYPERM
jgi:hypothetical protein